MKIGYTKTNTFSNRILSITFQMCAYNTTANPSSPASFSVRAQHFTSNLIELLRFFSFSTYSFYLQMLFVSTHRILNGRFIDPIVFWCARRKSISKQALNICGKLKKKRTTNIYRSIVKRIRNCNFSECTE